MINYFFKKSQPEKQHWISLDHLNVFRSIVARNKNYQYEKILEEAESVGMILNEHTPAYLKKSFEKIFPGKSILYVGDPNWDFADIYISYGFSQDYFNELVQIMHKHVPMLIIEEGFIRSVLPDSLAEKFKFDEKLLFPVGYAIDSRSPAFYSGFGNDLEDAINNETISEKFLLRSKSLMRKLIELKISKYNCQPSVTNFSFSTEKKKVLVVDQAYQDFSVSLTGGDMSSFENMLRTAIKENPGAEIVIKTHVDVTKRSTYYSRISIPNSVYIYSSPVNPIDLLNQVDAVYTYSSTMGWEGLMLGKEVHVFGSPIYAGWGLTKDRRSFKFRRHAHKTLEELFYFFYIRGMHYVFDGSTEDALEEALNFLVVNRERALSLNLSKEK